ncbi:hypothetical protein GCM10020218_030090 [Dactylosporangium vinaceum]
MSAARFMRKQSALPAGNCPPRTYGGKGNAPGSSAGRPGAQKREAEARQMAPEPMFLMDFVTVFLSKSIA